MKILSLHMQGFKHHIDRVEYKFTDKTLINAENAKGKTTIGDAIVWCLLGANLVGNERATNNLLNHDSKDMQVGMEFEYEGSIHNLVRDRKGTKNTIYLDGNEVSATDLIKFYKDKDMFLSIFNTMYFSNLSPKNSKELLNKVLPQISNEEIFEELSEYEVEILKENNFINPNLFLSDKRAELKELEKSLIFLEGVLSTEVKEVDVGEKISFDESTITDIEEEISRIDTEIENIESQYKLMPFKASIDISSTTREYQAFIEKWRSRNDELNSLQNIINCPSCSTEIDLDTDRKEKLQEELKQITVKGKQLKAELEKLTKENEIISKENEEIEKENEKIEINKAEALRKYRKNKAKLQLNLKELEKERLEVIKVNAEKEAILKQQEIEKKKIAKAKEDKKSDEELIKKVNIQIDAAKNFNSIKIKKQSEAIDQHLKDVEIRLERLTQQGELVDDFELLYQGKEFNNLSDSERIKVGLEVGSLIMNNENMKVPVFIDNGESITSYNAPDTQIIETRVVEGAELEVVEM